MAHVTLAAGHIFDDSLVKDLWKAAKSHVADKSAKVSAASFHLFQALIQHRSHFKTLSDFETVKGLYLKALDSPYGLVRQSAAKCFASSLIVLTNESTLQQAVAQSTGKSKNDDDEKEKEKPSTSKVKLLYAIDFTESLKILATSYTHASATTRVRVGIIETLTTFISLNDPAIIESRFFEIASVLLVDVLSNQNISNNRHKFILARSHTVFIIKDIIASEIMEEFGQTSAIKLLVNEILKNYPAVLSEQVEPSKETLIGTLESIEALMSLLGSAIAPVSEVLVNSLTQLISHPSFSVQVATCSCIRALVLLAPTHIIPLLNKGILHINNDLPQLAAKKVPAHSIIGYARMVSVLISLTYIKPLYSSIDLASRILSMATSLLKSNGDVDVFTSTVQIQVAWLLVSGLMPLGPSFVKIHLSHLLLLWKNALPKNIGKERYNEKSTLELCYLYHIRHCAIGSLVSFFANNSKLITADVARRGVGFLYNTTIFMSSINSKQLLDDEPSHLLDRSLTLQDYDYMLKRRILQCYVYLSQYSHTIDSLPANVLPSALATFADPEKFTSLNISTAIAANSGSVDSIWQMADNFAFGLTTKISGFDITDIQSDRTPNRHNKRNSIMEPIKDIQDSHWLSETDLLDTLEKQINTPVLSASEQDPDSLLHLQEEGHLYVASTPSPTAVTNLSMELFSTLFPYQPAKVQESLLVQLNKYILGIATSSNNGRPFAIVVNSVVAIHNLLHFTFSSGFINREHIRNPKVVAAFIELLKSTVKNSDEYVRNVSAQSLGMICSIAGSSTLAAEVIKMLIDEIVENRDPNARGGCALGLAYILKYVGGMFANLQLKTVLGILVSLATDPHPTVHFWALEAMSITISSVGLSFATYSSTTLSTLSKLYLLESHGDESSSNASSNLEVLYSSQQNIARCIHALVEILGPDLQDNSKSRGIVITLLQQFGFSDSYRTVVESIKSSQELMIFAPDMVDLQLFVPPLTKHLLTSHSTPLRNAAIDGLYQLIKTHSVGIFSIAGNDLKYDIWLAYDYTPDNKTIKNFIQRWLEQTATSEPLEWIARIQAVLFKPRKSFKPSVSSTKKVMEANLADEEVEGFANANDSGEKGGNASFDQPLKWQTRALAVEMLRELINLNLKDKDSVEVTKSPILFKVGELIRIAFTASTSSVIELRLLGVQLLNDILVSLRDVEDPDFKEVSLLEQYQAQIGSALTPAFSGDTSPELAAQAIGVCATFIGAGIIKNVDRMGRILKLLTSALESCSAKAITLGDLKTLSPNAQVMLKMAVLSSWAELQIASTSPDYSMLEEVVKPYISSLIPLWLTSLREFAQLRFEPEQSSSLSIGGSSMDYMYSALSRNSVLPFYQRSWIQLVDAIASLIEVDRDLVFDIMNEKERVNANSESDDINYSNEPAAFFFVLFGICFESLVRPQQTLGADGQPDQRLQVLTALNRILHPSVCGNAIYKDMVFVETIDVLGRIVLTGTPAEQQAVIDIAYRLCMNHPGNIVNNKATDEDDDGLSENVDQLFELVRIVMLVLTSIFPFLADAARPGIPIVNTNIVGIKLVCSSLEYLVQMIEVFPHVIRVDLYSCLLYVFGKTLGKSESVTLSKLSMIPFKKLVSNMTKTLESHPDTEEPVKKATITAISHFITVFKTETSLESKEINLLAIVIIFNGASKFLKPEASLINELSNLLVESLAFPGFQKVASECIQTLLISSFSTNIGKTLVVETIPQLVSLATEDSCAVADNGDSEKPKVNMIPRFVLEILVNFTKTLSGEQLVSLMAITVPLLLWFSDEENSEIPVETRKAYVNQKLLELVGYNSQVFKDLLQHGLSEWQREMVEYIMLSGQNNSNAEEISTENDKPETHIQLKSFT